MYLSSGSLSTQQLAALADIGFEGWEFITDGKQLDSTTLSVIQYAKASCGFTVSIHAPFSDLNIASVNRPIWRETVRQIKEAIALTSEYAYMFVIHPGYLSPLATQCVEKAIHKNNEALRLIARVAAEHDVRATVENMTNIDGFLGRYPQEIKEMTENGVGFTLDIGHANTIGSIAPFLRMPIEHVHVHDNNGKKDEHLVIGKGNVDWCTILSSLKDYKGALVIEARNARDGVQSLLYLQSLANQEATELA